MAKKQAPKGETHESSLPVIVELHRAVNKQFYVNTVKSNGRITFKTPETYQRREGALNAVRSTFGDMWRGDYRDHSGTGAAWVIGYYHK